MLLKHCFGRSPECIVADWSIECVGPERRLTFTGFVPRISGADVVSRTVAADDDVILDVEWLADDDVIFSLDRLADVCCLTTGSFGDRGLTSAYLLLLLLLP